MLQARVDLLCLKVFKRWKIQSSLFKLYPPQPRWPQMSDYYWNPTTTCLLVLGIQFAQKLHQVQTNKKTAKKSRFFLFRGVDGNMRFFFNPNDLSWDFQFPLGFQSKPVRSGWVSRWRSRKLRLWSWVREIPRGWLGWLKMFTFKGTGIFKGILTTPTNKGLIKGLLTNNFP